MITAGDHLFSTRGVLRRHLRADARGLATIEYALLLGLVLAGSLVLWRQLGESVRCRLSGASAALAALDQPASKLAATRCMEATGAAQVDLATPSSPIAEPAPNDHLPGATPAAARAGTLAHSIAHGHAWDKHVIEKKKFVPLGIRTKAQFAEHIQRVLRNAVGPNI